MSNNPLKDIVTEMVVRGQNESAQQYKHAQGCVKLDARHAAERWQRAGAASSKLGRAALLLLVNWPDLGE